MGNIDPRWHAEQVKKYVEEMPHYTEYSKTLSAILTAAVNRYAPESIVQARPKSLPSFAEKAARKREKYDNPAFQLTDLCGARAIVHTRSQMEAVCRVVRENFVVDEANSDDAAARLGTAEFGYRSVHFVVQMRKPQILGVPVPLKEIGERKAEIQVRTFLQHAWATITHDQLYKAGFEPSPALKRTASRLAALLEDTEEGIEDFEKNMAEYLGNYSTYLDAQARQREIEILKLVLEHEEGARKVPVALKLAKLARGSDDATLMDPAIKTLESVKEIVPETLKPAYNLEMAMALLQRNLPQDFNNAIDLLNQVVPPTVGTSIDKREEKVQAEAANVLAEALSRSAARCAQASEFYDLALKRDPLNPYHFLSSFENRPILTNERQVPESLRPSLLRAIETCRRHVDAGLEVPRAWFAMGRLFFLLGKPYQALDNYAKGMRFYLEKRNDHETQRPWAKADYDAELKFLDRMAQAGFCGSMAGRGLQASFCGPSVWMRRLLELGWSVRPGNEFELGKKGNSGVSFGYPKDKPVIIICGGAAFAPKIELARFEKLLEIALEGFNGVVVCGGTTSGIPGLIGIVAKKLRESGKASFTLVAYYPKTIPAEFTLDKANYDHLVMSDGEADFSATEPLQNWFDVLASGVNPKQVRVLGINGGDISRFEYALALALGASVGVLESSGRESSGICLDCDWSKAETLLPLPEDPMTLQAFINWQTTSDFTLEEIETMGRKVHEFYLPEKPEARSYKNPSSLPWEYVPEDFRVSSRQQAVYAVRILKSMGYEICKQSGGAGIGEFPPDTVERMAQMEHGRWNVERLNAGWRFSPKKDTEKRRTPFLKNWQELPERIKEYDRKAVKYFHQVFAAAGYQIVKMRGRS